ncbi:MAG: PDDEXK nuclease domain-containing protein [Bacteroidia bacterium]|nr:PDDEXK nuclease domain-containing protein [Bacteroidia bacterium]MCF8426855.1 PDDEXK nuclease domain-containing protein [Bacteroidia bacterium]
MTKTNNVPYLEFLTDIKAKIRQSQYEALKKVNKTLLSLYWDIGKDIVEKQEKFGWGKSIVETLSKDLQDEFPGMNGFSPANLWRIRSFYASYQANEKLAPLVREISWSHNLVIMERCKDELERKFYIQMTRKFGWSKNVLIHQIEGKSYEKYLLNQTNFDQAVPEKYKHQAKLAVKDEYNFEFLEISVEHSERELENALINNIRNFLLELGSDFTFVGNQYRLNIGDEDFYIDILLYHRKLKSLVAIELKTGSFKPEYAGKMNFYLTVLDETIKYEGENPSIGIIICKGKNKTIVEYALRSTTSPIGVSNYKLTETLPKEYKNLLPTPQEIENKLSGFIDNL